MVRPIVLSILLCASSTVIFAQHEHQLSHPQAVINGSRHRDLIPESTVHRLVLIAGSELPNPTAEHTIRQRSCSKDIGLSVADSQAAIPVLAAFKVQYTGLCNEYKKRLLCSPTSGSHQRANESKS
jgi:hypothetical protein